MRRLIGLVLCIHLGAWWGDLSAGFRFSHKNSTVRVGSSKFIINQPITGWNGTLEKLGSVIGSPILFSDGVLEENGTSARFTGSYDGDASVQLTLSGNQSLRIDAGSFTPKIFITGSGNTLEGQPLFLNSDSLSLAHHLSNLKLSLQSSLNSDITLNNGTIILGDNLFLSDDRTLTGSGKIILNRHRFAFGARDLHLTHSLDWTDATDVILNGRTNLSGIWTFTGAVARLNGNGNVLDLSFGGTILIKDGTSLYVSDVKLKGLGIGQIIFESKASQMIFSSVELEVASNYTFTTGGIYVEADSKVITGDNILTFAQEATLSVDQVTLLYDTLTFNDSDNIQPLVGATGNPSGKNVASVQDGKICHLDCGLSRAVINNSNTLLYLTKNNSNAILNLVNSNSANALCCRVNSNALLYLTKNNSNTILYCCNNNSNAILNLVNSNSANALCCRVNSNALLYLTKNNSNALLRLFQNNSQAILECCKDNSNALLRLFQNNSQALISCCKNNSNTLLYLTKNNSNALLRLFQNNSQALISCCKDNSNALLYLTKNNSNAIIFLTNNNSNTLLDCCRENSNALLYLFKNVSNASLYLTKNNSNALLRLFQNNSQALISCCKNNSNTLLYLTKNNSNALLRLFQNNSQALISCCKNNSNTLLYLTKNNSNALLRLFQNNSQALISCCKNNSNTLLYLTKNNSNALLRLFQNNSQALISCCKNNSNTLLYLTKNNSNALLRLFQNNSQALISCCKNNSNTLLYLTKNNSNALLRLFQNNSNTLLYCCNNNSNAIVKLAAEVRCCTLVQAPVTTDVVMGCNCIVDPDREINILNDLTIDGQGAWIEFCSPDVPQFIVADGVTVTLQNVTLMRINANTFSLGVGSTIVLGENVTFELEDDVTLNGEAFTVGGTIDDPFVWTVRGIGGKRRLILAPNAAAGQYMTLGFNTLLLENIEVSGIENIAIAQGVDALGIIIVGALGLGRSAEINVSQNTNATFVIEGRDNTIKLLDTGLALTGFILYSDIFDSELHIAFHLQDPIIGNPSVTFGPDLLFLSSAAGRASIIFDNFWAIVNNRNDNSFVTDANAFIGGYNIEINNFPIKQTSADLILDSALNLRSNRPNAIDQSFIRAPHFRKRPRTHILTALDIKRLQEYEAMQDVITQNARPSKPKLSSNREKQKYGKNNKYGRKKYRDELEEDCQTRSLMNSATEHFKIIANYVQDVLKKHGNIRRQFVLPTTFQLEQGGSVVKIENAANNILIHTGGVGSDFGIDPINQLNLYLGNDVSGDGTVRQGFKDTRLKPNDKIFVRNLNNRVQIQENFIIQGEIVMTPNSELIFEFLDNGKDPRLIFDADFQSLLDIPLDAMVRFIGRGTVVFKDGFVINLQGGKTPEKTKLIFDQGVLATLGNDLATVAISGDGKLLFDRGSQLNIRAGQHLIIGRFDEPGLPPDGIDITLDRESEWNINEDIDDDDFRQGDARISIVGGSTFSLRVDDEAKVYLGRQGFLEINAFENQRLGQVDGTGGPGVLTKLEFLSRGTLSFENGGQFILGLNKDFVPTFLNTKKGILETDGTGIAQFAGRNDAVIVRRADGTIENDGTAFGGLVVDNGFFIGVRNEFLTADIIRRLINRVPTLNFSTAFTNKLGLPSLELSNGDGSLNFPIFIVDLEPGDDVRSDDLTTGIVTGFNGGNLFTVDRAGNRTVSRSIEAQA